MTCDFPVFFGPKKLIFLNNFDQLYTVTIISPFRVSDEALTTSEEEYSDGTSDFKLSGRQVGNVIFDRFLAQNRCFLTFFKFFDQKKLIFFPFQPGDQKV